MRMREITKRGFSDTAKFFGWERRLLFIGLVSVLAGTAVKPPRYVPKSDIVSGTVTCTPFMIHPAGGFSGLKVMAALAPDYLGDATLAIDAYFDELRASYAPEIKSYFQVIPQQVTDIVEKIGAGDAIRTHDLNLGKVSLYP